MKSNPEHAGRPAARHNGRPAEPAVATEAAVHRHGDEGTGRGDDVRRRGDDVSGHGGNGSGRSGHSTGGGTGHGRAESGAPGGPVRPVSPVRPAAPGGDTVTTGPGDVGLLDPAATDRLQERWHDIQAEFVDDPRAALSRADQLTSEALDAFDDAVDIALGECRRQREAGAAAGGNGHIDTERLRVAMRGYRDLVYHLTTS
jgi:hypothetical protein